MKLRKDNSPISYNSISTNSAYKEKLELHEINSILRLIKRANEVHLATIREVFYVDDSKNRSKQQAEYRIVIEFGERSGQEYNFVTAINLYGGMVNFSQFIYSPKEQITKGNRNSDANLMFDHDGSQVVVAFMDGYPNKPFIIGGWNHTNNKIFAPKKADGIRKIEEFNGIRLETNKDGEYILTYYGGQRDTKTNKTKNANTAPTTFKIDKDGTWKIDDKENQSIKISRKDKKVTIAQYSATKPDEEYGKIDTSSPGDLVNKIELDKTNKKVTIIVGKDKVTEILDGTAEKKTTTFNNGLTEVSDGSGDKITRTFSGGLIVEENGSSNKVKWTIGGTIVEYDGTANKISLKAGSSEVSIDGMSGKIELKGSLVDVGTSASALAVLGPSLVSWLSSHVHMEQGDGAPTSPPLIPPPFTVLSTSVKIKS